jgi:hypothetical protein
MHAGHHPDAAPSAPMANMQEQMKAMRQMHDQMMSAKTPAQCQALMADHMKSMQGGMATMKDIACMGPMAGASGTGGDMAKRQQAMDGCAQMMEMMMQRMPNAPVSN